MKSSKIQIFIVILLLATLTLACRMNVGGPKPDEEILVSPDTAAEITKDLNSAGVDTQAGNSIVLSFSQEELTSYLTYEVDTSTYGVTNPQVFLEDGLILIYGQFEQNLISGNLKITLQPYLDSSGTLKVDLVSVDLGPVPAPDSLLNSLSGTLDQSLQNIVGSLPEGYQISSIEITNGLMTIVAEKI